ncbi:hypothetical protein LU276_05620 [Moraxella haemolytica]|uniref:hypothetical protein n=1 Tax=Moraxella haemolytica TaxID=2904119 RepID=UPI002543EEFC|nr:hypothetical protein [Moraxella sp. ZY171148]WII94516.1 hypothetical protein LU276_05620 [Moraxella sp. ZY171148]
MAEEAVRWNGTRRASIRNPTQQQRRDIIALETIAIRKHLPNFHGLQYIRSNGQITQAEVLEYQAFSRFIRFSNQTYPDTNTAYQAFRQVNNRVYLSQPIISGNGFYSRGLAGDGNRTSRVKTIDYSLISTGRTTPRNLTEQLAMREVRSNPRGRKLPIKMSDAKNGLYARDGWVKKAQNVNGVEIHYVENINTGLKIDFKFKD